MIDDDGAASLEVGFILNTEGAFAELLRFGQMFSSETQDFIRNSARIEAAAGGIKLAGATSAVANFGAAATREGASAAREFARVEKAGEAMARQLERQNSVFGKTREEVRSASAEFKAFAAEQQELTELAGRIRSEELALVTATNQAAAAANAQAEALRQAAYAHQMFEARVRAGVVALREEEAASLAAAAALDAQARRQAALCRDCAA
jgi:hypothetical protein